MQIPEGTTFAGYRIVRTLGVGGMGTVFLARHPRLPREDALKLLPDGRGGSADFRARFLREAELAARLQHPNLVSVLDRGEQDGHLWIAMQYVDGPDLSRILDASPAGLDPARAVHILTEAARGLDEIHRAGLLHRDVKPANLLVAPQAGGPERVLVTDFGIARPEDDSTTLADAGSVTATLAYAAPEQISGGAVDRRADVYALGCTLYQMLTGSVPFPRENPGAIMYAHLHDRVPPPSQRNPRLPAGFDTVIATAMAKRPADRYSGCGALAAAAQAALIGRRPPGRWRRPRVLAAAAAALAAVLVAAALTGLRDAEPAPAAAVQRPISGTVDAAQWGAYAYVAQTFPDLLPPTPMSAGYRELAFCVPQDERKREIDPDRPVAVARLFCLGNLDPVQTLEVICNADRTPIIPARSLARPEGDESWSRPSGSGRLYWGVDTLEDAGHPRLNHRSLGVLDVIFNEPDRNFCWMRVHGETTTGAALRDLWWTDAPL
ncbi:serine/threonine-protein kinase [Nocardia sp. IFM 10818]